jgi:hypothetical protein
MFSPYLIQVLCQIPQTAVNVTCDIPTVYSTSKRNNSFFIEGERSAYIS